ncbi:Putative uncharacterized protein FLJ37770, partial [Habropoda laboriosa]
IVTFLSMEQQAPIKFVFKSETYKLMQKAYGHDCLSRAAVFLWFRRFKEGRQSLEDDKREGRPSTSCTEANVESVRFLLANDLCLTIRLIADELRRHGSTFETNSMNFVAEKSVTIITHPPYSPDLAPADFFLFLKIKLPMKGTCYEDVRTIQYAVTVELNAITHEVFPKAYQRLCERSVECVARGGMYIEH